MSMFRKFGCVTFLVLHPAFAIVQVLIMVSIVSDSAGHEKRGTSILRSPFHFALNASEVHTYLALLALCYVIPGVIACNWCITGQDAQRSEKRKWYS